MAKKKPYTKYKLQKAQTPLTAQEKISRYMRGNKSKNTKPELALRQALWQKGLRGYRVHWPKAPGKPDICYPSRRLAVFVHGCFWHRCPYCQPAMPKTNFSFWQNKFQKNTSRDARYKHLYREAGWQQVVIWECQLRHNLDGCLTLIKELHKGVPDPSELAA
ncbi:very short patch repair endonuclease [Pontibacter silvestris]|uniref:Very short patch repair endonuclease n=1 Tax=Pontibacter silvestris TaxID=2305183 RepID=A0ABW4WXM7_9BACT|nr:very short patch repair endonuclease [Pontibacter silvestris]MCC9136874.1 very short patch repair endonuclease [Pontibacter silvestris]